jgi:hypothetical protein
MSPSRPGRAVPFDGFDPMDAIAPLEVLYAGGTVNGGAITVERVRAACPSRTVAQRVH